MEAIEEVMNAIMRMIDIATAVKLSSMALAATAKARTALSEREAYQEHQLRQEVRVSLDIDVAYARKEGDEGYRAAKTGGTNEPERTGKDGRENGEGREKEKDEEKSQNHENVVGFLLFVFNPLII